MSFPFSHLYGLVPALHRVPGLIPLPDQVLALLVQRPEVLGSTVKLDLGGLQHHNRTTHNGGGGVKHAWMRRRQSVLLSLRCTQTGAVHIVSCDWLQAWRCRGVRVRSCGPPVCL